MPIKSRADFLFKAAVPNFIDAQRDISINLQITIIYGQFKFIDAFHRLAIRNNVLVKFSCRPKSKLCLT